MYEFALPDLGEGIHEGEILKWFVAPGDIVKEDEPLVEVETDKAAVMIPSPKTGRVVSIKGAAGDVVRTGEIIAVIDVEGESAPASAPSEPKAVRPVVESKIPHKGPVPAAPAIRRIARELGVDINLVPGFGPGGRVLESDVRAFAQSGAEQKTARPSMPALAVEPASPAPAAAPAAFAIPFLDIEPMPDFSRFGEIRTEPLRSIRRKTAKRMTTSSILVPHVSHMDEADVTALDELRLRERAALGSEGARLTLLPFIVKAVVSMLKTYLKFNASIDPAREEIVHKLYYNVGIAVDSPKGLVVPVLRDADRKSVLTLSAEIADLAQRAREDKLSPKDFAGGTFTVTNIGPIGGKWATPVINYPETAILAVMRSEQRPVVRDGRIVIRRMLPLVLAFDHRVADGADAARFVRDVIEMLENPNRFLLKA